MSQQYLETTHHSVNWFVGADDSDQLEIAPSFQRRPVWSEKQKSDLIGTMLLGYPIPEIYVHEIVGPDGDETYRLVDGQQRVRAALDFVRGDFALVESEAVPATVHNNAFQDLGDAERKAIRNYKFVVRTLRDIDETVVKEMFRRLNQGVVALNDQELRHATYEGPFLELVEGIADRAIWSDFGVFTAEDIRRMRDVEFVSELAVASLNGPQNKKLTLDRWYQTYEQGFEDSAALGAVFDMVLLEIQLLVPELKRTRWRKRSDFYSLFSALARFDNSLPFSPDHRRDVSSRLSAFADEVDEAVRVADDLTLEGAADVVGGIGTGRPDETSSGPAARYADAVERAATDLARRRVREAILVDLIGEGMSSE